jgi:hypothetical protein
MKRTFFTISALLMGVIAFAQTKAENTQGITLEAIGAEYNIERAVAQHSTINFHGGIAGGIGFFHSSNYFTDESEDEFIYYASVTVGAQYRYYYNMEKRAKNGKNTRRNSANFWAVNLGYISPSFTSHNAEVGHTVYITPSWGLRRVYHNNTYIEFNPGIMCTLNDDNELDTGLSIGFRFGFSLK